MPTAPYAPSAAMPPALLTATLPYSERPSMPMATNCADASMSLAAVVVTVVP